MTKAGDIAYRLRWLILVLGGAGVVWYCLHWLGVLWDGDKEIIATWSAITMFLVLLFVYPHKEWVLALAHRGVSAKVPIISAMIVVSCISAVLMIALTGQSAFKEFMNVFGKWADYSLIGVAWVLWLGAFIYFWKRMKRRDMYTVKMSLMAIVFGAVVVEMVSITLLAASEGKDNDFLRRVCMGGYIFNSFSMLWLYGVGMSLLFARGKYLEYKNTPVCIECGYDLRGSISASCPECGHPVREGIDRSVG